MRHDRLTQGLSALLEAADQSSMCFSTPPVVKKGIFTYDTSKVFSVSVFA